MDYRKIDISHLEDLWALQKLYKAEIEETVPGNEEKKRLFEAIEREKILFVGAWDKKVLIGCCSVTVGFSTFNYMPSGVFEDFYVRPEYRHKGIARQLARYAYDQSGVYSLTVGCADCDAEMYRSIGFSIPLGNLLAFK